MAGKVVLLSEQLVAMNEALVRGAGNADGGGVIVSCVVPERKGSTCGLLDPFVDCILPLPLLMREK